MSSHGLGEPKVGDAVVGPAVVRRVFAEPHHVERHDLVQVDLDQEGLECLLRLVEVQAVFVDLSQLSTSSEPDSRSDIVSLRALIIAGRRDAWVFASTMASSIVSPFKSPWVY